METRGGAQLADYVHHFTKPGADGSAKGNIEIEPGARVLGVVYALDGAQLERLTEIEGGYRRIDVTPVIGGAPLAAVTFVARSPSRDIPPPHDWYLEYYRRGIEQHGIDPGYFDSLIAELARR